MTTTPKLIKIAVVLETDDAKRKALLKMASNNEKFDFVIQPGSTENLFDSVSKLKDRGYKISDLTLVGHGSTTYFFEKWAATLKGKSISKQDEANKHHIGMVTSAELNWQSIEGNYLKAKENYKDDLKKLKLNKKQLSEAKTEAEIQELNAQQKEILEVMDSHKVHFEEMEKNKLKFDEVSESMAPNANVELISCYGAEDENFLDNVGGIFLHKHGGKVKGNTGLLVNLSTKGVIEDNTDIYDQSMVSTGEWKVKTIAPGRHCNGFNHKPTCNCGWGGDTQHDED